jgi:hypothetical protein
MQRMQLGQDYLTLLFLIFSDIKFSGLQFLPDPSRPHAHVVMVPVGPDNADAVDRVAFLPDQPGNGVREKVERDLRLLCGEAPDHRRSSGSSSMDILRCSAKSSSRLSTRYWRSITRSRISSFIRSCRSRSEQTRLFAAASNFTYGTSGSLPMRSIRVFLRRELCDTRRGSIEHPLRAVFRSTRCGAADGRVFPGPSVVTGSAPGVGFFPPHPAGTALHSFLWIVCAFAETDVMCIICVELVSPPYHGIVSIRSDPHVRKGFVPRLPGPVSFLYRVSWFPGIKPLRVLPPAC